MLNNKVTADDLEAVFQILDAFIFYTPITMECYTAGTLAYYVVTTDVRDNVVVNPEKIAINGMNEVFYIISDFAAEAADNFYRYLL